MCIFCPKGTLSVQIASKEKDGYDFFIYIFPNTLKREFNHAR